MYNSSLQAYRAATPEYVAKQNEEVTSSHTDAELAEIRARLEEDADGVRQVVAEIVKMVEHDVDIYSQGGACGVPYPAVRLIRIMRKEEARACRLIEGQVRDNNITVADAICLLEKIGHIIFEAEQRIATAINGKAIANTA